MAFTYDPTTDRGKVRLLCFDKTATAYTFEDADIDAFLEQNADSVWLAAADACRAFVAKYAASGFNLEIPGALKLDKREVPRFFLQLAERYEVRNAGGESGVGVAEYIDSFEYSVNELGEDESEYV